GRSAAASIAALRLAVSSTGIRILMRALPKATEVFQPSLAAYGVVASDMDRGYRRMCHPSSALPVNFAKPSEVGRTQPRKSQLQKPSLPPFPGHSRDVKPPFKTSPLPPPWVLPKLKPP